MIKKYYKFILLCLGIAIIGYLSNKIISLEADKIGEAIKNKVMAAEREKLDKVLKKYSPLIAESGKKIDGLNNEIDHMSKTIGDKNNTITKQRKEILKLKGCDDKLIATNVLLDQAQGIITWSNTQYQIKIRALNMWYAYQKQLMIDEKTALLALHDALIAKYGETVKSLVVARWRARQRVNLGFFAGYTASKSWAVGFGFTFDLIKVPVKLF